MNALEASGLSKRYGKHWALENCAFELPSGSIAGLVGPNGAGKTTLLHIAVGLLEPTRGSLRILGERPGAAQVLPRVGFVAQDTPLYKGFKVSEMISFGAHMNVGFDMEFARSRIARLEIPPDQKAGSLSGGQRAQVGLALALAKRPEILLLDEPLASLDPLARREFLQTLMEGVADTGVTVVLSSHLLTDLERVCDHMMVLARGRFRLIGDTADIIKTHKVLIGPKERVGSISGVSNVLHQSTTDRQATLLVRTDGPIIDPSWMVNQVSLEDVVLAYLDSRSTSADAVPDLHAVEEVAR
ncbi:MAG TPA: ABC transporter ATP-binding protein [Actinomycetota bacterium]|nr:ABC transporter ATP-binding protein [Actinomycetota bacterium]